MQRPRLLLLTPLKATATRHFRRPPHAGVEVILPTTCPKQCRRKIGCSGWAGWASTWPTADATRDDCGLRRAAAAGRSPTGRRQRRGGGGRRGRKAGPRLQRPRCRRGGRDKHLMRTLLVAAGVPCPGSIFSLPATTLPPSPHRSYPCVVKPTNLNGSRGVMHADDPASCGAGAAAGPPACPRVRAGPAPIPGRIVYPRHRGGAGRHVGWGELTVLALFDKPDPLDGPFFEETIYTTPSRLPGEVQEAIARCAGQAAAAIGLQTGPIHAELRVNAQGRGCWRSPGGRSGGCAGDRCGSNTICHWRS